MGLVVLEEAYGRVIQATEVAKINSLAARVYNFFQPSLLNNAASRSTNLPRSEGSLSVSTLGLGAGTERLGEGFLFFKGGCEGATEKEVSTEKEL